MDSSKVCSMVDSLAIALKGQGFAVSRKVEIAGNRQMTTQSRVRAMLITLVATHPGEMSLRAVEEHLGRIGLPMDKLPTELTLEVADGATCVTIVIVETCEQ